MTLLEYEFVTVHGRELVRAPLWSGLAGSRHGDDLLCEPTVENAARLRKAVPTLAASPAGLRSSFGFGDRIGCATPGHVAALRRADSDLFPVLAQQSARELKRTGRSFPEVLAAATWGALRCRWHTGYGADADHLKGVEDVDAAAAAGFLMFTLDPSDLIEPEAERLAPSELTARYHALPWSRLSDTPDAFLRRHLRAVELSDRRLQPDEQTVIRAAVKFGSALVSVAELAGHVPAGADVEVSLDEARRATTLVEHLLVAEELARLGVRLSSLAPRFPGRLEKGIGYRGSVEAFAEAARLHADVARLCGPYKLSLHSGSDKLELYPIFAAATEGRFHIKTAGTSFLEALRVIAYDNPQLMREIWATARQHFGAARSSYETTADVSLAPRQDLPDAELPHLLDDEHARRILHVAFGEVLLDRGLATRVRATLAWNGGARYADALERHFRPHLGACRL